jgi:tyrocidine synthetase III
MTISAIIEELRKVNVGIKTKNNQIVLTGGKDKLAPELLGEIKNNKAALIEFINSNSKHLEIKPFEEQNEEGSFPLTAQQKSIWLASQNPDTATLYNQLSMFAAYGNMDVEALKASIDVIIKTHESLRMHFVELNGEPKQLVSNNVEQKINVIELKKGKSVTDVYKSIVSKMFDLSKPPLLKCSVIRENDEKYYLLFNIHHIISDGWSVNIFLRELVNNYNSFINKDNIKTTNSIHKTSFKEYVDFQNSYINSEKGKNDLQFWKEKLGENFSPTKIASKTDSKGLDYYEGDYNNFYIPDKIKNKVDTFCRSKKVTSFHFYSAIFSLLLKKYSGNNKITFGTPFSCRNDAKYNDVVGCFINTLPVVLEVEDKSTFEELLIETACEITEVFKRQNYPAEKIAEELKLHPAGPGNPLFDIILVYQNYSLQSYVFDKLKISYVKTPIEKCKAGLVFRIFEEDERLLINIEYSKKLFDGSFIEQIFGHFINLIASVLKNPAIVVGDISLFGKKEKSELIDCLNNTNVVYPQNKTIIDYLCEQFEKQKDKIAVTTNGKTLSYAGLDKKSTQLADYLLAEMNVRPNDIVGIMTGRNETLIIGIIAILKVGAAYLPINPEYPESRKRLMIKDSGCTIILTDDTIETSAINCLSINRILNEERHFNNEIRRRIKVNQNDPAYIIYTSGSTGKPKGVVVNHKNLLRLFVNDKYLFDFDENDIWTLFHSYSFDFSVWEIFGALLFGGKLIIVPGEIVKEPFSYYNLLIEEKVTVLNQTPSAFYRLPVDDEKLSIRYIIFGGEALQPLKLREWKNNHPEIKLINMYGITETTVHVTYKEITDEEIESGISNIGKPIPTLGVCVLDEKYNLIPKGMTGQICVYGKGVSRGYLNRPELTVEKFKNISPFGLCYLSGDLGRILENGDIEYLGRSDDQVQLHGFRIELSEIENALISIEGIKEAVVLTVGNENDINLNAFLVSNKKITNDFIRNELAAKIPGYMIPSNFVLIDAIPLTPNGKTDKQALLKLKSSENKKIINPANEVEQKILEAWKETLGDIGISTDESFFAIGGDSIRALKLVREINKKVNAGLTIAGLYENDTIKKIATKSIDNNAANLEEEVRKELISIENSSIERIHKNDLSKTIEQILPMSDIQRGMIYYSLKNPDSAIYHDQFVYQIYVKDFSFDVFKKSLELMMTKHSMLRTSFNMFDYNEDVQLVYKNVKPALLHEDLSGTKKNVIEKTVNDYVATERSMKFDITNPPLWRMKTFKAPGDIIIICWSFHHALFDGWSNASFFTELLSIYKSIIDNSEYKPMLLRGSYRHYIAEQNVIKKKNEAVNFWKNELADYKRLELPKKETGNIVPEVNDYYLEIDADLVSVLKKTAFDLGTDIKTIFFSAYIYCMSLLTHDNDVLVGIVTNNRPVIEDSEKILGCFLNTVPFRINVNSSQTWKDFILSIISKTNIQKKHEGLSLFEIVKNIGAPIGDSNPLFDVFFNYVDFNIYENIYDDYSLERHGIKEYNLNGFGKTNMPLDFTVANTFNKCMLHISYNSDSISSHWVKHLGDYFNRLLHSITKEIDDSQMLLKDISLVDKNDIELLTSYNNTEKKFDEKYLTVTRLYSEQLKNNKDKIGISFDDDSKPEIKYSVFNENVNKLAGKILSCPNSKSGGLIGVVSERNEFMIYAVMAILKSGNGYVPVDPYFPVERAKYIIEDSGCTAILCERKFKEVLFNIFNGEIIVIEEILAENHSGQEITFPEVAELDPLFLLYTSGSTGKPKGVLMPHKPVMNLFLWMRNKYPVENERILLLNPYTFDMSTWGLYAWAVNGSSVCVLKHGDEKDPAKIVKAVQEKSITSIHFVPSMLVMFLEYIEKHSINMKNTKLRYIFVAGEVLLKHLIDKFNKCFEGSVASLINLYGPTEAHVLTHFNTNELDEIKHKTVPIGRPISNAKILIVDKEMRVVPQGILGEILLGGDCLADGYINKPAMTSEKFITLENELTGGAERFYRSGDIGRWLRDGNIEFLGRNDFQIKIRGFRVEPDEVQSIINKLKGVKESLVIVKEVIPGDKRLIAYIVYEEKEKYDEGFVRNELKKQVADYMVPSVIIGMDKFPLTPNGKIDRKLLAEPDLSKVKRDIVTPRNKFEKKIAEIWSEVLNIDNIGINDNFFDIGGHSLLIIRVHSEIEKEINKKIEVVDLFKYPTIASLSEFINCGNSDNIIIDKAMQRAENQKNARKKRSVNFKKKGSSNE